MLIRSYQEAIIQEARGNFRAGVRSQLIVSPTGSGKTIMFSFMAQAAADRGKRVGILCHRVELLGQICASLDKFGVTHGVIAQGYVMDRTLPVQVASVFTLARRLDQYQQFDLLIIDEAHHAIPGSTWDAVIAANPDALLLGVTATPERLSGDGLGLTFKAMVLGPSTASLIQQGWLSPYRLFAPASISTDGVHTSRGDFVRAELAAAADKPAITGDAVAHYSRLARGKRALAFCVGVAHAAHVAEQFRGAGIGAAHIDGGMDRVARATVIRDFTEGRVPVLTSADLVSEGFDVGAIECAILLRPTKSLALYLQQVGRALRIWPGKTEAILLDHAGNAGRHGLPDDEREWSLEGRAGRKAKGEKDDAVAIKTCGQCFATVHAMRTACPHCNWVFPVQARQVEEVAGDLVEVDPEVARRQARIEQGTAKTWGELVEYGRKRGMRHPEIWARHVLRARGQKGRAA